MPLPQIFTPVVESPPSSSGGDSASDDDENDVGDDITKLQEMEMAVGTGLSPEDISKAKQSKSEKKARKCMLKLGLKSYSGEMWCWALKWAF